MMDFILLNDNRVCLIDDEDSDLKGFNWRYHQRYLRRKTRRDESAGGVEIYLHKIVLERKLGRPIQTGYVADHRNGNTCDNRRGNLREATKSENAVNVKSKGASEYRGVYLRTDGNRAKPWTAEVIKNGRRVFMKCFLTEEEAARAYDEQAKLTHGEFARLNFPDYSPTDF